MGTISRAKLISLCGDIPWLGRCLRKVARRYAEGSVVKVRRGHIAGCRWKRSHRHVSAYWLGIHELAIQECLVREFRAGDVFYDIGANAGFFSLLGSRCVGSEGRVFAFEPLAEEVRSIRAQLRLNDVSHCTVVEAAVADRSGWIEFREGAESSRGHVSPREGQKSGVSTIPVKAIALDDFVATFPTPDFVKMDVEGAELLALRGARRMLAGKRPPKMLIEFHSDQLRHECLSMLANVGYEFQNMAGRGLDAGGKDHHVLCIPGMKTKRFRAGVKVAPALSPRADAHVDAGYKSCR